MDENLRRRLIDLNRLFYHHHADAFSRSRQQGWRGWERLLTYLPKGSLRVLDIGCGNGRFALWLRQQGRSLKHYSGVDQSRDLLDEAQSQLQEFDSAFVFDLEAQDVAGEGVELDRESFDCTVLMAVLHHIPGRAWRQRLVLEAARSVRPGGVLVASLWCFDRDERWRRKRLDWSESELSDVRRDELEEGDHLLTFGGDRTHPRFCHRIDEAECASLVAALLELRGGWSLAECYDADGSSGADNHYLIFKRQEKATC